MGRWDSERVSRAFLSQAKEAERYCMEVRRKVKLNPGYKRVHDEHRAKFYVYNYLHARTFLESREKLVQELERILSCEVIPSPAEYYDLDVFESYRQQYIKAEISKLREQ